MPVKILMVCLGNICRSPLAEGILRSKLDSNFIIDSAGTGGWHAGESPDQRSIETAKQNNIDISGLQLGMYMLTVSTENGSETVKFIKQ